MLALVMVGLVVMGQTKAAPKAEARPDPLVLDLAKAMIPSVCLVRHLKIDKGKFHFSFPWAPK